MPSNKTTWVGNRNGASEPWIKRLLFQDGDTQAVKRGEILELSGGNWIPLDADQSMAAVIAVANEEIKAGDRAGYYEVIIPRPGDIFEFALDSASALAMGASLYWSDSQTVKASGSNVLGTQVGQEHYPDKQGHLSEDASGDAGTTIRNTSYARMAFVAAASYYAALQT